MEQHVFFALGLVIGLAAIGLLIYFWRSSDRDAPVDRSDVMRVWPLIFKLDKRAKRPTSMRFVVIGIVLYLAIVILGIKFG